MIHNPYVDEGYFIPDGISLWTESMKAYQTLAYDTQAPFYPGLPTGNTAAELKRYDSHDLDPTTPLAYLRFPTSKVSQSSLPRGCVPLACSRHWRRYLDWTTSCNSSFFKSPAFDLFRNIQCTELTYDTPRVLGKARGRIRDTTTVSSFDEQET